MDKEYKDIELVCICGESFIWTSGEQKFMDSLVADGKIQFVKQPKHCAFCRTERRAQLKQQTKNNYGTD